MHGQDNANFEKVSEMEQTDTAITKTDKGIRPVVRRKSQKTKSNIKKNDNVGQINVVYHSVNNIYFLKSRSI